MKKSITFIIQIFLDCEYMFPSGILTPTWVRRRAKFFRNYTLVSILNQDFQDFRIFLLCGEIFKHSSARTQGFVHHPKVDIFYDLGKKAYMEDIETDYVSITRIDSDDLFHKSAMSDVRDNQLLTNKRECLTFRECLRWDTVNKYLGTYNRGAPPYYTHIFPKQMYKYWPLFMAQHYQTHGSAGGKLTQTIVLPEYKVCVVKHADNHQILKCKDPTLKRPPLNIKTMREQRFVFFDKRIIMARLRDFGVKEEYVQ